MKETTGDYCDNRRCRDLEQCERSSTAEDDPDECLATLARALGHPARVRIVRLLLARDECFCGDICDEIPLAQSTVSQHLKVLREAGLIVGEISGPSVCYCVNPDTLAVLKQLIGDLR